MLRIFAQAEQQLDCQLFVRCVIEFALGMQHISGENDRLYKLLWSLTCRGRAPSGRYPYTNAEAVLSVLSSANKSVRDPRNSSPSSSLTGQDAFCRSHG